MWQYLVYFLTLNLSRVSNRAEFKKWKNTFPIGSEFPSRDSDESQRFSKFTFSSSRDFAFLLFRIVAIHPYSIQWQILCRMCFQHDVIRKQRALSNAIALWRMHSDAWDNICVSFIETQHFPGAIRARNWRKNFFPSSYVGFSSNFAHMKTFLRFIL